MTAQLPALQIAIPLLGAFITPLIGWHRPRLAGLWALAVLAGAAALAVALLMQVTAHGPISYHLGNWAPPWGIAYAVDHLTVLMLLLITGIGLMAFLQARPAVAVSMPGREPYFYTLFLLQVTGLSGIVITGDMFNLFVFLEISSLSGYALIALGEDGAPLATFNYIIIGTVGACFYLLGVGYLYIVTGSLNMADLANLLPALYHSKVVLVAFAFFTVGVAIKMGLFPLHTWMPDAYTTAPAPASALIAPLMTKVAAYVMIRIMFTVFRPEFDIGVIPVATILGWMAVIAILVGGIKALAQTDLKRMLTYIMVAEVGYIVMGISVMNRPGLTGAILHIMNDACMVACLFLVIGALAHKGIPRTISELGSLNRKMPFTMAAFVVAALSMCGLPPACGFFSKWYLVQGTVAAGQWVFAGTLLVSSLINAVLFFRVIEKAYLAPGGGHGHDDQQHDDGHGTANVVRDEAPAAMLAPILIMAALILVLGPFSGTIIDAVISHAVPAAF
ncbi:MAG: monovalent cation/H+ antiporter subunit D family protein [Deltaproteobacteria bacterium]|nr:monovalent cation/H+ antiporter subunit D family protein [Candidatus Anaeroferrophillacea bacterium]